MPGFEVAKTLSAACALFFFFKFNQASHLGLANFPSFLHFQYSLFLWQTSVKQPVSTSNQTVSISKGFTDLFTVLESWKAPLNFLISMKLNLKLAVSSSVSFASFRMRTQYPTSASPSNTGQGRRC